MPLNNEKHSVHIRTDTDDLYQELPGANYSLKRPALPYYSVETIHSGIPDEMFDDASFARKPIKETAVKSQAG